MKLEIPATEHGQFANIIRALTWTSTGKTCKICQDDSWIGDEHGFL